MNAPLPIRLFSAKKVRAIAAVLAATALGLGSLGAQSLTPATSASANTATPAAPSARDSRSVAVAPLEVPSSLAAALKTPAEREALQLFADLVHQNLLAGLSKIPGLQIVQRQNLSKILAEQNFGQSGNANPATAARIGELTGADILATVALSQFDFMRRETHAAALNRDIVTVTLDAGANLYAYNSSTGVLELSTEGRGSASNTQMYFANSAQQGGFDRASVTQAAQQMADSLVKRFSAAILPAKVVAVSGKQVTLNRGEGFFEKDDTIDIMHLGDELKDPDTGRSLGREQVLIGQGVIIRVGPQTAIAVLSENNGVQTGQVVLGTKAN